MVEREILIPLLKLMRHRAEHVSVIWPQPFIMARCTAAPGYTFTKRRHRLEAIARQGQAPRGFVVRVRIILTAGTGEVVRETAQVLDIAFATVQCRPISERQRFTERLADAPRPGTPQLFEPEQNGRITAFASEPPSETGGGLTYWTHARLATAVSG